jgi:hypothetical protein
MPAKNPKAPKKPAGVVRVEKALAKLRNKTPDQIAAYLKRRHCTGQRDHAYSCPVALFLKAESKLRCKRIRVESAKVQIEGKAHRMFDDPEAEIDTPVAVEDFVNRFDRGAYPELIS